MGDTIKVYSSNYDAKKLIMINPLYDNVPEYTDPSTNIVYPEDILRNYVNFTGDINNYDRLSFELSHQNKNTLQDYITDAKKNFLDLNLNHDLHSLLLWGQNNFDNYPTEIFDKDLEIPVITLIGSIEITLLINDNYVEQGYSALDNIDGVITNKVVITSNLNILLEGIYDISYDVTDNLGNKAITLVRKITVVPRPSVPNPYFTSANTITTNDDWPDGTGFEIAESSASQNDTTLLGWQTFRDSINNPNSGNGWTSNNSSNDEWVSITYPRQVILEKYVLTARFNEYHHLKKWKIQGSNDSGAPDTRTWTDIGSLMAPHSFWLADEVTEIDISYNKEAYSSYRVFCPFVDNIAPHYGVRSIGYIQLYTLEVLGDSIEDEVVNIPDMSWVWPSESSIISELKDYHSNIGNGREVANGYDGGMPIDRTGDSIDNGAYHTPIGNGVNTGYVDFIVTFEDPNTWCSGFRQCGHVAWTNTSFIKEIEIYTSDNNFGPWSFVTSDSHSQYEENIAINLNKTFTDDGTTTLWTPTTPSKYLLVRVVSNHGSNADGGRFTVRYLQLKVGVNTSN